MAALIPRKKNLILPEKNFQFFDGLTGRNTAEAPRTGEVTTDTTDLGVATDLDSTVRVYNAPPDDDEDRALAGGSCRCW